MENHEALEASDLTLTPERPERPEALDLTEPQLDALMEEIPTVKEAAGSFAFMPATVGPARPNRTFFLWQDRYILSSPPSFFRLFVIPPPAWARMTNEWLSRRRERVNSICTQPEQTTKEKAEHKRGMIKLGLRRAESSKNGSGRTRRHRVVRGRVRHGGRGRRGRRRGRRARAGAARVCQRVSRNGLGKSIWPVVHRVVRPAVVFRVVLHPEDLAVADETPAKGDVLYTTVVECLALNVPEGQVPVVHGLLDVVDEAEPALALVPTGGHLHHGARLTADDTLKKK